MSDLLNRIDLRFEFVTSKLAAHTITKNGCWEYQGNIGPNGYGRFTIYARDLAPQKRKFAAHRVSYAYYNGIDPAELCVCHHCDNPLCINPDHLFLGTNKDNTADMIAKGRAAPQDCENNGGSKLTREVVVSVVSSIRQGKTNKAIARTLPITHSQVSQIRLGKSWAPLLAELDYNPDDYRWFSRSAG